MYLRSQGSVPMVPEGLTLEQRLQYISMTEYDNIKRQRRMLRQCRLHHHNEIVVPVEKIQRWYRRVLERQRFGKRLERWHRCAMSELKMQEGFLASRMFYERRYPEYCGEEYLNEMYERLNYLRKLVSAIYGTQVMLGFKNNILESYLNQNIFMQQV